LRHEGPFALEVILSLKDPISSAYHNLVVRKPDGQNIAGWGINGLVLPAGIHKIIYRLPSFPIRPGHYYLYATCWDGGAKIDVCYLLPELIIDTPEHSILSEEWAGFLNVPCQIEAHPA